MSTEVLPREGPFSNHAMPPDYTFGFDRVDANNNPLSALRTTEQILGDRFREWDATEGAYIAARIALKELWQNTERHGMGPDAAWITRTIGGVAIFVLDHNRNDGQDPVRTADEPEDITDEFSEEIDAQVDEDGSGRGLSLVSKLPEVVDCGSYDTLTGNVFWVEVDLQADIPESILL